MDNIHIIKAPATNDDNCAKAPNYIKEEYDHEFDSDKFKCTDSNGYDDLYKYILQHKQTNRNDKIVTIGGNSSIMASTISAINESYINITDNGVKSNLKIIVISSEPKLHTKYTTLKENIQNMVISSIIGYDDTVICNSKLLVESSQIFYFGLHNIDDEEVTLLNDLNIIYFDLEKINNMSQDFITNILKMLSDSPLHVSISMTAFNPSQKEKLNVPNVFNLLQSLSDKVVSLDIVDFNVSDNNTENITISEICKQLIINTLNIKQKTINIFNENSEFLIYRSLEQNDVEDDIGWYILRNIDINTKKEIMLQLNNDCTITIDINDEEYMITSTTVKEQQDKIYYNATTIMDFTLFPQEKQNMVFDLIN